MSKQSLISKESDNDLISKDEIDSNLGNSETNDDETESNENVEVNSNLDNDDDVVTADGDGVKASHEAENVDLRRQNDEKSVDVVNDASEEDKFRKRLSSIVKPSPETLGGIILVLYFKAFLNLPSGKYTQVTRFFK